MVLENGKEGKRRDAIVSSGCDTNNPDYILTPYGASTAHRNPKVGPQ